MNIQERESGLLVATGKAPRPVPPPEHPARKVIRDALAKLSNELGEFEQTTHGVIGQFTIENVASKLAVCYERPTAYSISNLSQYIDGLLREASE